MEIVIKIPANLGGKGFQNPRADGLEKVLYIHVQMA